MGKLNFSFFLKKDMMSNKIFKHIGLSSLYKSGSILIGIILVPLSIEYLGNEKYGLWLTIFSFIGWFSFVDFGIGNGLRNKLSEAIALENYNQAKTFISTSYITIGAISLITVLFFSIVFFLIDWPALFNFDASDNSVERLIFIGFVLFSINLTLKNINSLYFADQRPSVPELISFLGQLIALSCVLILIEQETNSILFYGTIIFASQMLIMFLFTVISFSGKYHCLRPSFKEFDWQYVKEISTLGGKFFIIQISASLLFTTDNFIINKVLGSSEVTTYSVAHKYFMLVMTVMILISSPYWSAFTKAISEKNRDWLISSLNFLRKISILVIILTLIMIIIANWVYKIWVGDVVKVPILVTIFMGLNAMQKVYNYPKLMFLNGSGKIWIELYLGFTLALLNIPLSIFLARNMDLGIAGVILSTLLVGFVEFIVYPIQVNKILNHKARGVWNK
jgi:O-antigen/teichoic acid export membrane protein